MTKTERDCSRLQDQPEFVLRSLTVTVHPDCTLTVTPSGNPGQKQEELNRPPNTLEGCRPHLALTSWFKAPDPGVKSSLTTSPEAKCPSS